MHRKQTNKKLFNLCHLRLLWTIRLYSYLEWILLMSEIIYLYSVLELLFFSKYISYHPYTVNVLTIHSMVFSHVQNPSNNWYTYDNFYGVVPLKFLSCTYIVSWIWGLVKIYRIGGQKYLHCIYSTYLVPVL